MGLIMLNLRLAVINQIRCVTGVAALATGKSVDTVAVTELEKSC